MQGMPTFLLCCAHTLRDTFLWTIYTRHRSSVFGAFDERKGWWHFLWKDFCHALAMYWILLMVSLASIKALDRCCSRVLSRVYLSEPHRINICELRHRFTCRPL